MKNMCVILCAMAAVACVNGQGIPTKKCPPGEHSVLYCPRKAEPDCVVPEVHAHADQRPRACDIPDCFCDAPAVRDLRTRQCVPQAQCPNNLAD